MHGRSSRLPSLLLIQLLLSLLILLETSAARARGNHGGNSCHKVQICHIPPGNPGNAHTITVDASAVQAHLAHGDTLGACGPSRGPCATNPCLNRGICSEDSTGGFSCQCISNGGLGETVGNVCACAPGCVSVVTGGCVCSSSG